MSWPNLSLYPPIRPDTPRPSNKRPRAAGSGVQIVRGRSRLLESGSTPTPLGAETLPRETQAQASAQRVGRIVALASDLGVPRRALAGRKIRREPAKKRSLEQIGVLDLVKAVASDRRKTRAWIPKTARKRPCMLSQERSRCILVVSKRSTLQVAANVLGKVTRCSKFGWP